MAFTQFKQIRSIAFLFLAILWTVAINAQPTSIEQTEKQLNKVYGIKKLDALNRLTQFYRDENPKKSFRYSKQAALLADNLFAEENHRLGNHRKEQIQAYFYYGQFLFDREKYIDAKEYLDMVIELSIENEIHTWRGDADTYLQDINARIASGEIKETFLKKTVGSLGVGKAINKTSANLSISTELKIAGANEKNGDFQGAINHYEKAINLLRNQGEASRIRELQLKIAVLLDSLDQHVEAQKLLNSAIAEIEDAEEDKPPVPTAKPVLDSISVEDSVPQTNYTELSDSIAMEKDSLIALSQKFYAEQDYEKSLQYLEMYKELSAKMEEDSMRTAILQKQKEDEILLLIQQKEIADLNVKTIELEKERQVRYRKTILFIALFVLIGTVIVVYFYIEKRREHRKLTLAYSDLDRTKTKLEEAELRIVTLLKQQVSGDIANELLSSKNDNPEKRFVCVMFLDIRDFTPMAEKLSPEELIRFQNQVFGFMIDIVQKNHGNINQLLGDGFMATFGAPVSHGNDCQNALNSAHEIIRELEKRNNSGSIPTTKIGIGLHAGNVVTGNVGNDKRKQYSVTGNPVIIASRVEQLNKKYNSRLILTEKVFKQLEKPELDKYQFTEEKVKGRKDPIRIVVMK